MKNTTAKLNKDQVTITMSLEQYTKLLTLTNKTKDAMYDISETFDLRMSDVQNLDTLSWFLRMSMGFEKNPDSDYYNADLVLPKFKIAKIIKKENK